MLYEYPLCLGGFHTAGTCCLCFGIVWVDTADTWQYFFFSFLGCGYVLARNGNISAGIYCLPGTALILPVGALFKNTLNTARIPPVYSRVWAIYVLGANCIFRGTLPPTFPSGFLPTPDHFPGRFYYKVCSSIFQNVRTACILIWNANDTYISGPIGIYYSEFYRCFFFVLFPVFLFPTVLFLACKRPILYK